MTRKWIVFLLAVTALAGAQEKKDAKEPTDKQSAPAKEARSVDRSAAPAQVAEAVDDKTFLIGVDDVISIRIWKEPELSTSARVRSDGKIVLPLAGEITAVGRTPAQLTEDVAKAISGFINNPLVMVSVLEVNSRKYSITGEVTRPGSYSLATPISVLDAVIRSGFKDYAKKKKITILRKGQVLKFNYEDVVKGKSQAQNIMIEDGDLIVIP